VLQRVLVDLAVVDDEIDIGRVHQQDVGISTRLDHAEVDMPTQNRNFAPT
jgi:hypothetical protein